MGSSILDYLDSNWGSLLGMNSDPSSGQNSTGPMGPGGQGAFAGPPPPLPPTQAMPPPPMASSGTPFVDDLGNPVPGATPATGAPSMPPPSGPPGAANAATPPGGGVTTVPMTNPPAAPAAPGVPLPQPRPQDIPTDTGPVSTAALPPATTVNGGRPGAYAPPGGAPAPPPPGAYGPPPPMSTTGGGMPGAFGLSPVQSALAGVGRGLENVGKLRFGASGAQAFAAGAGGGLQGGIADQERQQQQKRQLQNDLFNQRSIAYKDMLDGIRTGDNHQVSISRSNFLDANRALRQSGAKDVFSGTPYAKARDLETALDKEDESLRKRVGEQMNALAKERQAGFGDSDVQEQEYARLKKELQDIPNTRDQRRQDRAKRLGIPVDEFKRGTDRDHAWDGDNMPEEQLRQIPEGAIFKQKDPETGKDVYQKRNYDKKPPYEGWQRPQGPQQQQAPGPTAQSQILHDALYGDQADQNAA